MLINCYTPSYFNRIPSIFENSNRELYSYIQINKAQFDISSISNNLLIFLLKMQKTIITLFVLLSIHQTGIAQNIRGKIIDAETHESIPYANIKVNDAENLVSNSEGFFSLSESNSADETALTISYIGYANQQITVGTLKKLDFVISIAPVIFELSDVNVSNEKPNPYEIMANVKANLASNYKSDGAPSKDLLFYRRADYFKPKVIDVEIEKSTGFTKQALKKVNSDLKTFSNDLVANPPKEFTDILSNYYTTNVKKDDKSAFVAKLEVLKATKLKNEGSAASSDELEKKAMNLILQHLDSTKYYRFKSGLFGSRDSISLRKDFNRKKEQKKSKETISQLTTTKRNITSFLSKNNFSTSKKFNFITNPELYSYNYEETTYFAENEFAYVLTFKPKRSKAKYSGKLYISENDYAVLRVDYTLEEGEKLNSFNMKLLLGVKAAANLSKGTLRYQKKADGSGYYLQYATVESGQYFYLNRPVKFIELTSAAKDVLSLDLKVEGNASSRTEFLNISRSNITATSIEKIKESDFKFINIKSYDSKIWKEFNALEPQEEMKRFKASH